MSVTAVVLLVAIVVVGGLCALGYTRLQDALDSDPRIVMLRSAVKNNPDDVALRSQLASMYSQVGQFKLALREYDRILSDEPENLDALYNTGRIRMMRGNEGAGEDAFREVLRVAPTHAYAAAALGFYLEEEERLDEIATIVGPAAEAQPSVADLQYLMGVAFEDAGDADAAVEYYRRAVALVPDMDAAVEALNRLEAEQ